MSTVEPIRNLNDLKRVEKVLEKQNLRNVLFFVIGTKCGLRISDIVALNVSDVLNKKYLQIIEKKTKKFKKIPINSKILHLLKVYLKDKKLEEPLFTSCFGNRLNRFSAYRIIKNACKIAGLEDRVGTHTLRKTFGYHHYQKFKDVALLQKIFNHSAPDITLRYIGINQEQIENSYANFIL